jgi:hypothetical protein
LASTPEIVAHCRSLEYRWLRLAQRAQATGGALGHDRDLAPSLVPLCDETAATCPDYGKRAGELIARGARSLRATLWQKKSAPPREPNGS